jgi:hypothetical protein
VRPLLVALLLVAGSAPRLTAQADVAARLDRRVPPPVARAVTEIAAGAAARGLPVEPLVQKAIEGGAKRVAADRVIAAVRALATQLEAAAAALRAGGIEHPGAGVIEGGADALSAGLNPEQIGELARTSKQPYDPAMTLRVAATLASLGVPPKQTVDLMEGMMQAGRTPNDLLSLPTQVQEGVARGRTPAQAAGGLGRGAEHAPWAHGSELPPGQAKTKTNPHKP